MSKSTILHTGRASLCALGAYLRRRCFFAPLREQVTVPQKTVRYRPIDKVLDALVRLSPPDSQNCRLCKFSGGSWLRCFQ